MVASSKEEVNFGGVAVINLDGIGTMMIITSGTGRNMIVGEIGIGEVEATVEVGVGVQVEATPGHDLQVQYVKQEVRANQKSISHPAPLNKF